MKCPLNNLEPCEETCAFREESCMLADALKAFELQMTNLDYDQALTVADSLHVIANAVGSDYVAEENNVVDKLSHIEAWLGSIAERLS